MSKSERTINQGRLGKQEFLYITDVPSGASAGLKGQRLIDAGALTVAGDYNCDANIEGLREAYTQLKATFAVSTVTSDVYSTYLDGTTSYQGATGDGALTTTVLQTATLTGLKGERKLRVKITLGATPNATFTQGEVNGAAI